ncbi:MAG: hypothetical protein AAI946_00030 [Candidatus Hodgkinia cicadicola]
MIISVNNSQYKSSCFGLVKLKNTAVNTVNIITGKLIYFRCGNEIVYNNAKSSWLALIRPIGQTKERKLLGMKFKRRKTHKKTINTRPRSALAQVIKLILIPTPLHSGCGT